MAIIIDGVAVYDSQNPNMTEFKIDELQLVLPETKKDYWIGLLKENGWDENWINNHVIFIPPQYYEKKVDKFGRQIRMFNHEAFHEYILTNIAEETYRRSRNKNRVFVPAFGPYPGWPQWMDAGSLEKENGA